MGDTDVPAGISLPLDLPSLNLIGSSGSALPFAEVNSVIDSASILHPGRATVTVRNLAAVAEQGFISLTDNVVTRLPGFSRVQIKSGRTGETVFVGNLMKPKRSWSGEHDSMILQYEDDRCFLRKIPMRGCFVYDTAKGKVVFLNSYDAHLNPEGYQNCCVTTPGNTGPFPAGAFIYLFSQLAAQGTWGVNDDSIIGTGDEAGAQPGDGICWTAYRWLQYCISYLTYVMDTGDPQYGRFAVLDSTKINLKCNITNNYYTERKMPDLTFKGKNAAQALHAFEEVNSAYGLRLQYNDDGTSSIVSYIRRKELVAEKKKLFVQVSGTPNFQSVWKGEAESDYSNSVTGTLVEGGRPHIEAEFIWTGLAATSSLVPAWGTITDGGVWSSMGDSTSPRGSQELDFMYIVALAQDINGIAIPNLTPCSPQALALARASYPKVFRAYRLYDNGSTGQRCLRTIMAGAVGGTTDLSTMPWLAWLRPLIEEQLQPYLEYASTAGSLKRANQRVPVRIQVSAKAATTYANLSALLADCYDVGYSNGVRPEKDGFIYFDGLTDDADRAGATPNLYISRLVGYGLDKTSVDPTDSTYPALRAIILNAATVADSLPGNQITVADPGGDYNGIASELDPSVVNPSNSGPALQHYIQNAGFKTEHQVNSKPALDGTLTMTVVQPDGSIGPPTNMPIPAGGVTKELRSDYKQLTWHMARRHEEQARVNRTQKYVLPGCQYAYKAGDFITTLETSDEDIIQVNDFIANIELSYSGAQQITTLHFGGGNVA